MKKRNSFWKYFFELLVVFLGVTAAFMLDQWAENRAESKRERQYLENIYNELEQDLEELQIVLAENEGLIKSINSLANKINKKLLTESDGADVITPLYNILEFRVKNYTWESLKGSSELNLFKNLQIKISLLKFYDSYKTPKLIEDIAKNYLKDYITPFAVKNIDLTTMKIINLDSVYSTNLNNIVQMVYSLRVQYGEILKETRQNCTETIALLERQLNFD